MSSRWMVTVSRMESEEGEISTDLVVIGPFRSRERADERAATIERLAATYEDDATLAVVVEPLLSGAMSAQHALHTLYGAVARADG